MNIQEGIIANLSRGANVCSVLSPDPEGSAARSPVGQGHREVVATQMQCLMDQEMRKFSGQRASTGGRLGVAVSGWGADGSSSFGGGRVRLPGFNDSGLSAGGLCVFWRRECPPGFPDASLDSFPSVSSSGAEGGFGKAGTFGCSCSSRGVLNQQPD